MAAELIRALTDLGRLADRDAALACGEDELGEVLDEVEVRVGRRPGPGSSP